MRNEERLMKKQAMLRISAVLIILASVGGGRADDIAIVNAGFEDPPLAEGDWTESVPGWTNGYYALAGDPTEWLPLDPNWHDGYVGCSHPETGGEGYPEGAIEGTNVAYSYGEDWGLGDEEEIGINQILDVTLQANTWYKLSVYVGNPFVNTNENGSSVGDHRIELLAGGVLLAKKSEPTPDSGEWEVCSFIYDSGYSNAQLGQPLEIRLIAEAPPTLFEVNFDDVHLETLSLPGTVLLVR